MGCTCKKPVKWYYGTGQEVLCSGCNNRLEPAEVGWPSIDDWPTPSWWAKLTPEQAWLEYVHVQAKAAAYNAS